MSYDIEILTKREEFLDFIEKESADQGLRTGNDIDVFSENISCGFLYSSESGILYFPYNKNSFTVNLAYMYLIKALNDIDGFEFTDLQSGQTFTKEDASKFRSDKIIREQQKKYTATGNVVSNEMKSLGMVITGESIEIPEEILHRLTSEIYLETLFELLYEEEWDALFRTPFLIVNQKTKEYKIIYLYESNIDLIIPDDLPVDYIVVFDPEKERSLFVPFDRLDDYYTKLEPKVNPALGTRDVYKVFKDQNLIDYIQSNESLQKEEFNIPEGFLLDKELSSVKSV